VQEPARSPTGERRLWDLAQEHLPAGRAGDYNQALMDLGSQICVPHNPRCSDCPLQNDCQAYQLGIQEQLPVSLPRKEIPHYLVTAAVIRQDGKVLLTQRPPDGLLGGLWEFPGGKVEDGESLPACLEREICEELGMQVDVGAQVGVYRHAYTHFRVTLHAFFCKITEGQPKPIQVNAVRWVYPEELEQFPMGKIDRQIASRVAGQMNRQFSS
jgi:A/G-specific adenine glycosylase